MVARSERGRRDWRRDRERDLGRTSHSRGRGILECSWSSRSEDFLPSVAPEHSTRNRAAVALGGFCG
jgi:hypothetical protein